MEGQITGMEQVKEEQKEQTFQISEIVSEFPEAYQIYVKEQLDEVETALDNFILSLVF